MSVKKYSSINMKRGSIMFCPKCGTQVPDGSPFCSSCGAPLGQQQAPMNQGGFGQPTGNAGGSYNQMDFKPANLLNDFKRTFSEKKFEVQQFIAFGGVALLFITLFLPFFTASSTYKSYIAVSGGSDSLFSTGFAHWFFLLFLVIPAGFFFAACKRYLGVIAAGGVALLDFIIEWATFGKYKGIDLSAFLSKGVGFWFLMICTLAILGAGIWGFLESKKKN